MIIIILRLAAIICVLISFVISMKDNTITSHVEQALYLIIWAITYSAAAIIEELQKIKKN